MLVEMGIADSYGAGREYAGVEFTRKSNDLRTYRPHHKWVELIPGNYTDDTQMAIALAELMLEHKDNLSGITQLAWANKVVAVFKRDPHAGYAGGFYKLLQEVGDGAELLARITPHSHKNGGAMRAAPAGLLDDPKDVRDFAMWQASLTHATHEGMQAAAASALLVHGCRTGVERHLLDVYLVGLLPGHQWGVPWEGRVGAPGFEAVHAALTAIMKGNTLSNVLWECVNFTGDVDTVAAIAVAAASMHPEIPNNLHPDLYKGFETGPYGHKYLLDLDQRLYWAYLAEWDDANIGDHLELVEEKPPEDDGDVFSLFEYDEDPK